MKSWSMMQKNNLCQNLISCILSSETNTNNKNLHQIGVTNYLNSTVNTNLDNHYTSSSLSTAVNMSTAVLHSMSVEQIRVISDAHEMFSRLVRLWTAGHTSNKTICIKIQFSVYQHQKRKAQKGRTKSALLIWTKSDLSDKVLNRYFTIWPRFGTGYLRFGN